MIKKYENSLSEIDTGITVSTDPYKNEITIGTEREWVSLSLTEAANLYQSLYEIFSFPSVTKQLERESK